MSGSKAASALIVGAQHRSQVTPVNHGILLRRTHVWARMCWILLYVALLAHSRLAFTHFPHSQLVQEFNPEHP
eukprot:1549667-Amphidinium_carterae.1